MQKCSLSSPMDAGSIAEYIQYIMWVHGHVCNVCTVPIALVVPVPMLGFHCSGLESKSG